MIFSQFLEKCNTELHCIDLFIEIYYQNKLDCPLCHCASGTPSRKTTTQFQYNCCNKSFSIFHNTIFMKSHIDFRKWLYAFYLLSSSAKNITANHLASRIKVNSCTAWRLISQLKKALNTRDTKLIGTLIEINDKISNNYLTHCL